MNIPMVLAMIDFHYQKQHIKILKDLMVFILDLIE